MLDWYLQQERYADLVREAERERLAQQARPNSQGSPGRAGQAMVWLGSRLVAWGWRLQAAGASTELRSTS